jgi:hypothetical protein
MSDLIDIVKQLERGDPGIWIAAIGTVILIKLFWDAAIRYSKSSAVVFCVQVGFLLGASYLMIIFLL